MMKSAFQWEKWEISTENMFSSVKNRHVLRYGRDNPLCARIWRTVSEREKAKTRKMKIAIFVVPVPGLSKTAHRESHRPDRHWVTDKRKHVSRVTQFCQVAAKTGDRGEDRLAQLELCLTGRILGPGRSLLLFTRDFGGIRAVALSQRRVDERCKLSLKNVWKQILEDVLIYSHNWRLFIRSAFTYYRITFDNIHI